VFETVNNKMYFKNKQQITILYTIDIPNSGIDKATASLVAQGGLIVHVTSQTYRVLSFQIELL
jgi:hypothetical protein